MSKLFWIAVAFLVTVTSAGAVFFEPRNTPEIADKNMLVNVFLKDQVNNLYQHGQTIPDNPDLIVLSTSNLRNLRIPKNIREVSIKVLAQYEIDQMSRVDSVNYIVFDRVEKTHAYTGEVEVTFFWGYEVDAEYPSIGLNSGGTYFYSNRFGEWVETGGWVWIP